MAGWELELGDPYLRGGRYAWVAPARDGAGQELVLKVGGVIERPSTRRTGCATCAPGRQLKCAV